MSCFREEALSAPSDRPAVAPAWDAPYCPGGRDADQSAFGGGHCDCWWEGESCCRCGAPALPRWERFVDWLYCVRLRWLGW